MRIAVFCPSFIGDTVMATPTFRALRRGFPGATLTAVIKPQVAPTLDGTSWFDEWIYFDHRSRDARHRTLSVLRRLRRARLDLAVLLPNSFRSGLMAFLGGVPRRVGYERHGRGILLTEVLHHPLDEDGRRLPTPIVDTYLKLARHLGCPVESSRLELATTPADEHAADRAWFQLGLDGCETVVCLNTGGTYGPAKNWPIGHFVDLARRLAADSGVRVLILCGPRERETARRIVAAAADKQVVSLADQELGIGLTKACIRRASLLITTDSGPRHFATAFGTPVLTLFGPTHIAWTRTHHPMAWHVKHPVPCGPCQRPVCPEGHHKCMHDLAPEGVYRIARRLIGMSTSYAS
jgi:lipopolysaccharide heptosyltransferase II